MKQHHFDNKGPLPEHVGDKNVQLHKAAIDYMRKRNGTN
jgi:hypothetical protein